MALPRHRLVVGPFAALEPAILAAIADAKRADPLAAVEVLVGSNLLAVYLRRRYAAERGAVANLRFLTFVDLAREMVSSGRPTLPSLGAQRLALRALRETPEAARFGVVRERASLASALLQTVEDLREAGLSADTLADLLPRCAATADRRAYLSALGATFATLERLRAPFEDPTALLTYAASEGRFEGDQALFVYGLYDLGGLRESLLARVAESRPIVAFVPDDGDDDGEISPPVRRALFERLLAVSAEAVVTVAPPPDVRTVLARDESDEARETVREVVRGVEEGIPLHRMAILLRHPEGQEPALRAELGRAGVPFFRPPGPGFSRSPLGRSSTLLLELSAHDFPRAPLAELLDLLGSMETLSRPPLPGTSPGALTDVLGELAVVAGRDAWLRRADALSERLAPPLPAEEADSPAGRRRQYQHALIERFRAAFTAVSAAVPDASPTSWATWGKRLAEGFGALFAGHPDLPRLSRAAGALARLEEVERAEKVSAEDVLGVLPEALDLEPLRWGQFERDGIALLSAISARGLLFDAVFVPGLVERSFPAPGRPDPLLFDDERAALRDFSGAPLPGRAGPRHAREERFLFRLAAGSARKRLVFLAAVHDPMRDRDRLLSPYLADELEARAGRALEKDDLESEKAADLGIRRLAVGRLHHDGPALDEEEVYRRALDAAPGLRPEVEALCKPLARAAARARARRSPRFTAYEGLLGGPLGGLLAGRPASASRLERLAGCPYRAFLADALRIAPRKEPLPPLTPDRLTLGSLVHAALRDLVRHLPQRSGSLAQVQRSEQAALVKEAVRAPLASWAAAGERDLPPVFLELVEGRLLAALEAVLAYERARVNPLKTAGAEVRFGPPTGDRSGGDEDPDLSTDESPTLEASGRSFTFSGRIDRLDRQGELARVVDYKLSAPRPYGKTNKGDHLIAGGERLQLALYALAVRQMGARDVESEYLFLVPEAGGYEVTPAAFDNRKTELAVGELARFLDAAAEALEAGLLLPLTWSRKSATPCKSCDYADVCGPGHEAVYERKWEGDRATGEPILRMREAR